MNKEQLITKYDKYIRNTANIAWPAIAENILSSLSIYIDAYMVSLLGTAATAAVGVNSSITWLINSLSAGFAVGGTVLVANNLGAGRKKEANIAAEQTLSMSLIIAAIVSIIMIILSPKVPIFMGAEPEILKDATDYIRVYSYSIFPHFCGLIVAGIIRGSGDTKSPMIAQVSSNVINLILNYLLIYETRIITLPILGSFTMWGAGLGVKGAAIATSIGQAFAGFVLLILIFNKKNRVYVEANNLFKFDKGIVKRVIGIGSPAAAERISMNIGQIFFQRIIISLGTVAVAANFLATMAESISYMPANGLSVSATTLVGQALGGKKKEDAEAYANVNILFAVFAGIFGFSILFFFPEKILGIMSDDPQVIAVGAKALRVMALAEPLFNLSTVFIGVLRSAGDTKTPLIASLIGVWVIRLGTAYFFTNVMGLGLQGAWIGMALDHTVRFIFLFFRYRKKHWLESEVL